jgi:hypothetical protein
MVALSSKSPRVAGMAACFAAYCVLAALGSLGVV